MLNINITNRFNVGIKILLDAIRITVAHVLVNTAQLELVLLLVSHLELLGEKLSQEDVNQKLLRSLSPEWNTHAVVWRNKIDMYTISMDDLYNNLKVYEPEVKGITNGTVNNAQAVNTANEVSTASTQVNVAFTTNIDNLSDASDQAEEGPNYALMAFTSLSSDSKVSNDLNCLKSCLETVKLLKSQNEQLLKDLKKFELMVLEIAIKELRMKLKIAQKEKDGIQITVDKLKNASKGLNKLIECQIVDNCKKGLWYENYNAVPTPYTGNFMPSTPDLSFTRLDEFDIKPVAENTKSCEEETKVVRKNDDALIIEEWVSDDEEENVTQPKIVKKTVRPNIVEKKFVKPRQQEKTARKIVKKPSDPTSVADEVVNEEMNDSLEMAVTTSISLEAEQDRGNIFKTQFKETPNEPGSQGTSSGGDGKEIIITESSVRRDLRLANEEGVDCLLNSTIFENFELMGKPKRKNTQVPQPSGSTERVADEAVYKELDDRLVRVATTASSLEAEQDSGDKKPWEIQLLKLGLKICLNFLMIHCSQEERKIDDIDQDEDITLVNDQDDAEMFDVNDLQGEEVLVEKEVADKVVSVAGEVNVAIIATTISAAATITIEEITLDQALVEIKTTKPKTKGIVLQEPSESPTTTTIIPKQKSQDKGKGKKLKDLKNKSFDSIQKIFNRAFKRVSTFLDFRTELAEGSSKRAGEVLTQESAKKKKVVDDKETTELKQLMEIILDEEEVAINAIPLAVKSPRIVY
nr:hypothetical protein [Tanacetum cinerariifolium]